MVQGVNAAANVVVKVEKGLAMANTEKGRKEKKGRAPCCYEDEVKKGAWTPEEDKILVDYINKNGPGPWRSLPQLAGLQRCGKSCRLRWKNYLRPGIKRGGFTSDEVKLIIKLHNIHGNKWAAIASNLPGRTDNEIKNLWHTHLKKQFPSTRLNIATSAAPAALNHSALSQPLCIPPVHLKGMQGPKEGKDISQLSSKSADGQIMYPSTLHVADWESTRVQAKTELSMDSLLLRNPSVTVKKESNYYVQLWNSEIGDSFRMIKKEDGVESGSGITMQEGPTYTVTSGYASDEQSSKGYISSNNEYADFSNFYEMQGSSDSALNLLLDFPSGSGGDYMEFLKQEPDDYSSFH